jgi:hypothetical protein
MARHGQKHGQANRGKAEANNLFAEVLSASGGLSTDVNVKANDASTNTSRVAKKGIQTTETPFDAGMAAFNLPLAAAQAPFVVEAMTPAAGPTINVPMGTVDTVATPSHKDNPLDLTPLKGEEANGVDGEVLETAAPKNTATPKDTHTQGPNHAEKEPVATVGKAVSAAAKVAGRVLPPPQALTQAMGLDAAATQAWHMSIPGNPGNRLQAATAETSPAASPETAVESGPAGQGLSISRNASQDASAGGKGEGGANLLLDESQHETLGTADADSNASSSFAASLGEAMGDAFQNLGTQVSYWASQNVKRASINLDIGTDQALQVEVTLDGDKAQLDFRTNDASARVALQNNAEQVLNDLLARSGLGLAGFSVGSHAHQSAQQNPHPSHSAPKGHANQFVKTSEAESITAQRWTPRSTSSVDIYA